LLKGFSERGFAFFTNYDSRKGRELTGNPNVALVFLWRVIARQVIVTGVAERASAEESDTYFASRPRGSQLGAWASPQSQVIDGRAVLEDNFAAVEARYRHTQIPRPPGWGGFVVEPATVEFWQGRDDRLHDRLRYRRPHPEGQWVIERLAP